MHAEVAVRLDYREPLWPDSLFGHLAATAVPGVEEWRDGAYRRTLSLAHGPAIAALRPGAGYISGMLALSDRRDLAQAVACCRRLLDLDAVPEQVSEVLAADPVLAPLVAVAPGRRVPGCADPAEMAIRAVLGQQVSTAAARTHAGRLAAALGPPVSDPGGGLTRLFPRPGMLAQALSPAAPGPDLPEDRDGPDDLVSGQPGRGRRYRLAMPAARQASVAALAGALASGDVSLDPGAVPAQVRGQLAALPGLGPWTVETIMMRALADPDAFIPTDLGVRAAAVRLGLPATPAALTRRAAAWRPWRAYAVQYLWATGDHEVNYLPGGTVSGHP